MYAFNSCHSCPSYKGARVKENQTGKEFALLIVIAACSNTNTNSNTQILRHTLGMLLQIKERCKIRKGGGCPLVKLVGPPVCVLGVQSGAFIAVLQNSQTVNNHFKSVTESDKEVFLLVCR